MSNWPRSRCAVVGIGSTDFTTNSGVSEATLVRVAAEAAITDSGLSRDDIDGIIHCDNDSVSFKEAAVSLGLREISYSGIAGLGGGAPCAAIGQAVAAIISGEASTVLVYRGLNGRSGRFRPGRGMSSTASGDADRVQVGGNGSYEEYFLPFGLIAPAQQYALAAQQHMMKFGTTAAQLAQLATTIRTRANANSSAQMHREHLTVAECLDAPIVSTPLRRFDCCLETDGACAVIVTSAERAGHLRHEPVLIRAVAQGSGLSSGAAFGELLLNEDITSFEAGRSAARTLFQRAGLGPSEVNVAQIYDCFTITALIALEDYGFCEKGEGGPFVESGEIDLGGRIPINTAGGNLSEGYIHGMSHVLEAVRQIRGTSTSTVPGVEVSLVTSGAGAAASAMILVGS